jgi:hypothetical protein
MTASAIAGAGTSPTLPPPLAPPRPLPLPLAPRPFRRAPPPPVPIVPSSISANAPVSPFSRPFSTAVEGNVDGRSPRRMDASCADNAESSARMCLSI